MHPALQNIFISFVSAGHSAGAESAGVTRSSLPCAKSLARGGESDPVVMQDSAPVDHFSRSHEDLVRELDELIRANDRLIELGEQEEEEAIPLFLQRAAE